MSSRGTSQNEGGLAFYGRQDAFLWFMVPLQVTLLLVFYFCAEYNIFEEETRFSGTKHRMVKDLNAGFLQFLGLGTLLIVGFGYLYAFLKRAGLTAVGFPFFLVLIAVQFSMCFETLFANAYNKHCIINCQTIPAAGSHKIQVDINSLQNGLLSAATCLVTVGTLIGKCGLNSLMPITILELLVLNLLKAYILPSLGATDVGGTLTIHLFGAFFGVGASLVLGSPRRLIGTGLEEEQIMLHEGSSRTSNLLSFFGVMMLWLFFPALNAATTPVNTSIQRRALVNSIFALLASATWTVVMTKIFTSHRFSPKDIQNSAISGGAVVGICCTYPLHPSAAMGIGMVGATLCTFINDYAAPLCCNYQRWLHDTAGVVARHGIPGLAGGLMSTILCCYYQWNKQPSLEAFSKYYATTFPKGPYQWEAQIQATFATLALALVAGALSMLVAWVVPDTRLRSTKFADEEYWVAPYDL